MYPSITPGLGGGFFMVWYGLAPAELIFSVMIQFTTYVLGLDEDESDDRHYRRV